MRHRLAQTCPLCAQCTKAAHGRRVKRYPEDVPREALRRVMQHPQARAIFSQRKAMDVAAQRERRSGTAKLALIDIDQLSPAPAEDVSLDTFVVAFELEGSSQRDQLAAFKTATAMPARASRVGPT